MRFVRPIPLLAALALAALGRADPHVPVPPRPTTQTVTYLGVVTTNVPPALSAQLGLPAGDGVVVEAVDPDGPAARAGLMQHDVVLRLDRKPVGTIDQFGLLVRACEPGQHVQLDLIRHGQPATLPVRLGGRQVAGPDARLALPNADGKITCVVQHVDPHQTTTLVARGQDEQIRIVDAAGATVFEGPVNTPAELDKVPEACREKVRMIQQGYEQFKQSRRATTSPAR